MKAIRDDLERLMPRRGGVDSHPGLLLQRYLHHSAAGDLGDPEHKQQVLRAAINAATNADVRDLYAAAFSRWKSQVEGMPLTASNQLTTDARLIVGLGSENVLEAGIRLHHTYGFPIIPGSALKGLAAHYCDRVWGERDQTNPSNDALKFRGQREEDRGRNPPGDFHKLLFGATDDRGCIIFHDAWYVPESDDRPLKLDVMTPHHSGWNDINDPDPPSDFDSPVPVPFLSVAGTFHVAISWCGPPIDEATDWRDLALACLRDALCDWGIGGKTSSGYGRFDRKRAEQNQLEQEAARQKAQEDADFKASLDDASEPLRRLKTRQRNEAWQPDPSNPKMLQGLADFVDQQRQSDEGLPDDCVEWIRDWLESMPGYKGVWAEPDAMKGKKKDKPKYNSRTVRELVKKLTQSTSD